MNHELLWEQALAHLHLTESDPEALLALWRSERPENRSHQDLLAEYAWVVFACGLTPNVLLKHWEHLTAAFCHWDSPQVCVQADPVRIAALGILKNPRKVDAVLAFARDVAAEPELIQRLAALPVQPLLAWLTTLPFIGPTNRYHLARNLGWDLVVRSGPVARLAEYLGSSAEALCTEIACTTGERTRTVDLVLWQWAHQVGDRRMKEFAWLCR